MIMFYFQTKLCRFYTCVRLKNRDFPLQEEYMNLANIFLFKVEWMERIIAFECKWLSFENILIMLILQAIYWENRKRFLFH